MPKQLIERTDLFTYSDLARMIGIDPRRVWLYAFGHLIPKPEYRLGRRCYYKQEQVPELLRTLKSIVRK